MLASVMLFALLATSCGPKLPAAIAAAPQAAAPADADGPLRSYKLTLSGYNYSDSGISSFEVNGQGGGNLEVSIPTAGGGKSTCCAVVHGPLRAPLPVTIKWSRDVETWCEQTVLLQPPLPAKPEYFEVHFYRDGHIEIAVTESASPPRLRLERDGPGNRHANSSMNVNNDAKSSRCKLGYR